jgi:outer membrane protein OmpA-like peptidoglycan-associated protein
MRKSLVVATLFAFAAVGSTACATKGFVKQQVSQVSGKVDTLSGKLEETQERTRQNEGKINDVDQKAAAANGAAMTAQQAASAADQRAASAGDAAKMAAARTDELKAEMDKAAKRITYEVVLSEDSGNFKFGKSVLPDEAKAKIDELITSLKADPKGAHFEIEGHTDNTGDKAVNMKLGEARAEAVKRYLYEQHQIPLHLINVISYGSEKPAGDNKTKAGRAQNRRVVIRVLA